MLPILSLKSALPLTKGQISVRELAQSQEILPDEIR